jgi:hypothetical protein
VRELARVREQVLFSVELTAQVLRLVPARTGAQAWANRLRIGRWCTRAFAHGWAPGRPEWSLRSALAFSDCCPSRETSWPAANWTRCNQPPLVRRQSDGRCTQHAKPSSAWVRQPLLLPQIGHGEVSETRFQSPSRAYDRFRISGPLAVAVPARGVVVGYRKMPMRPGRCPPFACAEAHFCLASAEVSQRALCRPARLCPGRALAGLAGVSIACD